MWKVKKKNQVENSMLFSNAFQFTPKLTCIIYDPKPHPSKSDAQCWTFMPRYRCQKGLRTSIRSVLIMLLYSQCFAINHSLCWLSSTSLIEVKLLSVLIGNDISRDYVVVLASLFYTSAIWQFFRGVLTSSNSPGSCDCFHLALSWSKTN